MLIFEIIYFTFILPVEKEKKKEYRVTIHFLLAFKNNPPLPCLYGGALTFHLD